jgi:acetylornithine deacetylase/succinyl-diaminopimelate desuccinylase-like protein
MRHPYTDVQALKEKFDFQCINFSIGYYKYHTRHEYVIVEDVFNGIEVGKKMIESLGYTKHTLINPPRIRGFESAPF